MKLKNELANKIIWLQTPLWIVLKNLSKAWLCNVSWLVGSIDLYNYWVRRIIHKTGGLVKDAFFESIQSDVINKILHQ